MAIKSRNASTSQVRVNITDKESGDGSKYLKSLGDGQVGKFSRDRKTAYVMECLRAANWTMEDSLPDQV